jgi:hypothetical protein
MDAGLCEVVDWESNNEGGGMKREGKGFASHFRIQRSSFILAFHGGVGEQKA